MLIIAAVKYANPEQIKKIVEEGSENFPGIKINNLGWSTVQHFLKTIPILHKNNQKNIRHHFIGHLQTNKISQLLQYDIELIHSVDNEKLLHKINIAAAGKNKIQKILVQIKSDSTKKFGFTFVEVEKKISQWKKLPHIKIEGFMTIPAPADNAEKNRAIFHQIKKLAGKLNLKELSMGMSDDYEIAIKEGATMVRLGKILFKTRQKKEAG